MILEKKITIVLFFQNYQKIRIKVMSKLSIFANITIMASILLLSSVAYDKSI